MDYNLQKIYRAIEVVESRTLKRINKCVAVKSVSSSRKLRRHVEVLVDYFCYLLRKLKFKLIVHRPGHERRLDGDPLKLPKVIFGQLGNDFRKRTVLFYGHVDVVDAKQEDGWDGDPFIMQDKGSHLVGRGVADNKGPILAWLGVIECFQAMKMDIPVNLKIILEGMHESGSEGLRTLITESRVKFLKNVDFIVMSNTFWMGSEKPCIAFGVRGLIYFFLKIRCANKDLHAGNYGGNIHEATAEAAFLLNSIADKNGRILVPNFYDDVNSPDGQEMEYHEQARYDTNQICHDIGHNNLLNHRKKIEALIARGSSPWFTVHGIEGDFNEPGGQTVIPHSINVKFSIRVVPEQNDIKVIESVKQYLRQKHREYGSPNYMEIIPFRDIPAYVSPTTNDISYMAGKRAVKRIWGVYPDVVREGASIPIAAHFAKVTQKSILFLPIAQYPHNCHEKNETISKKAVINGMKVVAAYLYEVAAYREKLASWYTDSESFYHKY